MIDSSLKNLAKRKNFTPENLSDKEKKIVQDLFKSRFEELKVWFRTDYFLKLLKPHPAFKVFFHLDHFVDPQINEKLNAPIAHFLLCTSPGWPLEEIKKNLKVLKLAFHPDKNLRTDLDPDYFLHIIEAGNVLNI